MIYMISLIDERNWYFILLDMEITIHQIMDRRRNLLEAGWRNFGIDEP